MLQWCLKLHSDIELDETGIRSTLKIFSKKKYIYIRKVCFTAQELVCRYFNKFSLQGVALCVFHGIRGERRDPAQDRVTFLIQPGLFHLILQMELDLCFSILYIRG